MWSDNSDAKDPIRGKPRDVRWVARKLQPVTLIYVLLVFGAFMAVSHFVVHSASAVKSLALAAVGGCVALLPHVIRRTEYHASDTAVEKRPFRKNREGAFEEMFRWTDLSHVVRTKHGYKFFRKLEDERPVVRFLKLQLSDRYSGELHVEAEDRKRVENLLKTRNVPIR